MLDCAVSAENFGIPAETTFFVDHATENISHLCENLNIQVIDELDGEELVEDESEIESEEDSISEQEHDTDHESDDDHENASDIEYEEVDHLEYVEVDGLDEQPNLYVVGHH